MQRVDDGGVIDDGALALYVIKRGSNKRLGIRAGSAYLSYNDTDGVADETRLIADIKADVDSRSPDTDLEELVLRGGSIDYSNINRAIVESIKQWGNGAELNRNAFFEYFLLEGDLDNLNVKVIAALLRSKSDIDTFFPELLNFFSWIEVYPFMPVFINAPSLLLYTGEYDPYTFSFGLFVSGIPWVAFCLLLHYRYERNRHTVSQDILFTNVFTMLACGIFTLLSQGMRDWIASDGRICTGDDATMAPGQESREELYCRMAVLTCAVLPAILISLLITSTLRYLHLRSKGLHPQVKILCWKSNLIDSTPDGIIHIFKQLAGKSRKTQTKITLEESLLRSRWSLIVLVSLLSSLLARMDDEHPGEPDFNDYLADYGPPLAVLVYKSILLPYRLKENGGRYDDINSLAKAVGLEEKEEGSTIWHTRNLYHEVPMAVFYLLSNMGTSLILRFCQCEFLPACLTIGSIETVLLAAAGLRAWCIEKPAVAGHIQQGKSIHYGTIHALDDVPLLIEENQPVDEENQPHVTDNDVAIPGSARALGIFSRSGSSNNDGCDSESDNHSVDFQFNSYG